MKLIAESTAFPDVMKLGQEFPPYRRTFGFKEDFIDTSHRAIALLPVEGGLIRTEIPGFLRQADALTLYELAYFSSGDILEMGSAWGLSTTILCRAAHNARRGTCVVSIEINSEFQHATMKAVRTLGLQRCFRGLHGEAGAVADRLIAGGKRFGFIFIDHDHTYASTRKACRQLSTLLTPGGLALFHDFNDERNRSEPESYGVYRAVAELMEDEDFAFLGIIGCSALVQRRAS